VWLAIDPLDMRSGSEAALARVVHVFGSARQHDAYLFANRMKVLVHDGIGLWLATRRLNQGKFVWPKAAAGTLVWPLSRDSRKETAIGGRGRRRPACGYCYLAILPSLAWPVGLLLCRIVSGDLPSNMRKTEEHCCGWLDRPPTGR
jgi:transposase